MSIERQTGKNSKVCKTFKGVLGVLMNDGEGQALALREKRDAFLRP